MPSLRLTRIDELTRRDHWHLEPEDQCYWLREYTSHVGYQYSATNQLISNLKKPTDRKDRSEWKWKGLAIRQVAGELKSAIPERALRGWTFVPIPPSKVKGDPGYDDRMVQVVAGFCGSDSDWRELLLQQRTMVAAHETAERPSPDEIAQNLAVNEGVSNPPSERIALVDDVLTTGAHFVAAKRVLQDRFPGCQIVGVFVARRVFDPVEHLHQPGHFGPGRP